MSLAWAQWRLICLKFDRPPAAFANFDNQAIQEWPLCDEKLQALPKYEKELQEVEN